MNLLVKPASYRCNLDCAYCFYTRTASLYPEGTHLSMSEATVEAMIEQALALGDRYTSFCWQGGEPTLMGLDFYRTVIDIQSRLAVSGQVVEHSIQTNGINIDDDWAAFLAEHRILVGLSLDGPKELHDRNRKDRTGRGSYNAVMKAAETMERQGADFNILTLLTSDTVSRPDDLYGFFMERGFHHLQFIPCVDVDPLTGAPCDRAVTGEELGLFYTRLFDLWLDEGFPHVSIRLFEDLLLYMLDGIRASCFWLPRCDSYLAVEHNGDLYPCDFYVDREHRLGNIHLNALGDLVNAPKRKAFSRIKTTLSGACRSCRYVGFCRGDCPRHRLDGRSMLCDAWTMLFGHLERHPVDIRARALEARRRHGEAANQGA